MKVKLTEYDFDGQKVREVRNECESFECESEICMLCPYGVCLYPLFNNGRAPTINEDGCNSCIIKMEDKK